MTELTYAKAWLEVEENRKSVFPLVASIRGKLETGVTLNRLESELIFCYISAVENAFLQATHLGYFLDLVTLMCHIAQAQYRPKQQELPAPEEPPAPIVFKRGTE